MSEKKRTPAEQSADLAEMNASLLRERLHTWNEPVRLGLVLGTGWGDALKLVDERTVDFGQLPGFEGLADLPGHERKVVYGRHSGISVVALRGRVHVNESFTTPDALKMVRLQIEMLEALGVRDLVLTAAVGSLDERISVGDVVIVNSLVTLHAPALPLHTGEFCSPEDELDIGLREMAQHAAKAAALQAYPGTHVMVRGPFFEGRRVDKRILAHEDGAQVVGMSILPELAVFSATCQDPKRRALALTFVTNTASEQHSHEDNQARAKANAPKLAAFLAGIISRISAEPTQP